MGAGKVRTSASGNQVIACCPIHGERRPSFGVAVDKPGHPYNCYACHASGVLPGVAVAVKSMCWKEALAFVSRFGDYSLEDRLFSSDAIIFEDRFDDDVVLPGRSLLSLFTAPNIRMRRYLRGRGVSNGVIHCSGLRRFAGKDAYESRIIFPWFQGFQLVGFTSRSYTLDKDALRGVPLFEFKKHQQLYRAWGARPVQKLDRVVVVEGEIDALRVQSCGYNSVALSGTVVTKSAVNDLCALVDQAVVLMDNDSEGEDAYEKLVKYVAGRIVLLEPTVLPSEYTDPGDSSTTLLNMVLSDSNLTVRF